jgi:hypothetical protein
MELLMACPTSCTYNEIREPLTVAECASLTAGNPIGSYATVCDYLKSLPARLWDLTNHLENLGNYGSLAVNDESKCKSDDEPTAASLTSEFALFADSIACYLCGGLGNTAHFHDEGGTDFNQSATEPVNIPAPLKAGDTVIEDFDDYLVFWTYDGTAWVKNFTHNKADANSTFETYNTTIPVTYTTPNTIPTDPEAGDTLIEQFTDGLVYWTYDGTNWVKNFTDSKDIHSYHILQTGNAPSLTPAFPVPITTAQAGDTAIVKWDDGEAKYTFDGTSWILDWFEPELSGGVSCEDVFNNGAEQASPILPTNIVDANSNVTTPNVNGDIPFDTTGNVGYVLAGKLRVPGGAVKRQNTTYVLTPAQTVGSTATSSVGTFTVPSLPFDTMISIRTKQIVATSYAAASSSHQIRMDSIVTSTNVAIVSNYTITQDKNFGFGPYSADSNTINFESTALVPANTPAFTISTSFRLTILGVVGTPSAAGTSGLGVVQLIPRTEVIA